MLNPWKKTEKENLGAHARAVQELPPSWHMFGSVLHWDQSSRLGSKSQAGRPAGQSKGEASVGAQNKTRKPGFISYY